MEKYIIHPNGPLNGEVKISGSKNAVLPIMAAALLSKGDCIIKDVPKLRDVEYMKEMLSSLGSNISQESDGAIKIRTDEIVSSEPSFELVNKMRASILVMGPLLARTGRAVIPYPGGCAIGARPTDLHTKGFEALGAMVVRESDYIEAKLGPGGLVGTTIYLDFPSVGATENIMMAATLAKGTTYIENAAEEPEIVDLAIFLNKMGAKIKGAGTDTIKIEGVDELGGANHTVIPDRIETGTFMLAAAITRGEVTITNTVPDHVKPIIAKLKECGVSMDITDEEIVVHGTTGVHFATDIKTLPYPGFPTDIQSPFMAYLSTTQGSSTVIETVFENRFMHVSQLCKMGAMITTAGNKAEVKGGSKLRGCEVMATDLRAGAALVLAALAAEGDSVVTDITHIERGYENFVEKLRKLGADIHQIVE